MDWNNTIFIIFAIIIVLFLYSDAGGVCEADVCWMQYDKN